jgi:hypothetical protein
MIEKEPIIEDTRGYPRPPKFKKGQLVSWSSYDPAGAIEQWEYARYKKIIGLVIDPAALARIRCRQGNLYVRVLWPNGVLEVLHEVDLIPCKYNPDSI